MKCLVEYVWLGGNKELRSKTRVYNNNIDDISQILKWDFDGSSTGQASGVGSEVILKPRRLFRDPFRKDNDKIVLCDTYYPDGSPLENNFRHWANDYFNLNLEEEPWFGLEQEYFLINPITNKPLGFPANHEPEEQGKYYCSVGTGNAFGRNIAEEHMMCCVKAGIKISGINAEVAPGQWEFQIGPCVGIEQGDHLWIARYLLHRVCEKFNVIVDFEPKPVKGDWNGSGCHANYSTKKMREGYGNNNGLYFIDKAIEKLSKKHMEHMAVYGENNKERMTGEHETASYDKFTDDVANRGCSIRRGNNTVKNGCGYFEDRRPSSNCDPYLVTAMLFKTTVCD